MRSRPARPLTVLDLGAGNGWLSYRVAGRRPSGDRARYSRRLHRRPWRRRGLRRTVPGRKIECLVALVRRDSLARRAGRHRRCSTPRFTTRPISASAWRSARVVRDPAAAIAILDSPLLCARSRRPRDGGRKAADCGRAIRRTGGVAHGAAVRRIPHARAARRVGRPRPRLGGGTASAIRCGYELRPLHRPAARPTPPVALRPVGCGRAMILLVNPRATRPSNRRFPAVGHGDRRRASGRRELGDRRRQFAGHGPARGRQRTGSSARRTSATRSRRSRSPSCPDPSWSARSHCRARLKAPLPEHPDHLGRQFRKPLSGPGAQRALCRLAGPRAGRADLRRSARGDRRQAATRTTSPGWRFRESDGSHFLAPERTWAGPDDLPDPPYHKINVADYLHPTFLGRRSGVYQASIGCPFGCNFCGVIAVFGRREKVQSPTRVARNLEFLVRTHGMDSVHFYDNNFFLNERHAREIAAAMAPLGMRWWCEARVDMLCRLSDATWRALRQAGLTMVFCGAESGSDAVLERMNKGTTTAQIDEVAGAHASMASSPSSASSSAIPMSRRPRSRIRCASSASSSSSIRRWS